MSPSAVLLLFLLLVCGGVSQDNSTNWDCFHYGYADYNGPLKWAEFCPACGCGHQSPIFIERDGVDPIRDTKLEGSFFDLDNFGNVTILVENDGHGVKVRVVEAPDEICIHGTNLDGLYCLDHVDFKWGLRDEDGTEHKFDFFSLYGMERQWGFYSKRYKNYEEARMHKGGVARMGQPIILGTIEGYTFMEPIVELLPYVREPGQVKRSEALPAYWFQPDLVEWNLFYVGSLTEPPCTPGVLWMLFAPQAAITKGQLAEFRKLMSPDGPLLEHRRANRFRPPDSVWSQSFLWLRSEQIWPFLDFSVPPEVEDEILGITTTTTASPERRRGAPRSKGASRKHHKPS